MIWAVWIGVGGHHQHGFAGGEGVPNREQHRIAAHDRLIACSAAILVCKQGGDRSLWAGQRSQAFHCSSRIPEAGRQTIGELDLVHTELEVGDLVHVGAAGRLTEE